MKAASFLAFGLIAMLFIAGCGKTEPQAGANAATKVFKYPLVTSPTTLDPGKVQDGDTIDAVQQVFEGLVGWSPDNKPEGRLAEKWEVQDGGKTYLFTLRPGIKFTSGREVKAKDFKDCFERACDPAFASPTAPTYLSDIVGVKERLAGKAKEVTGYQAVGDNQVKITLDKPRPYFLGKLTYLVAAVYDLEKLPDPMKEMAKTTEMVGTGPFIFDQFVPEATPHVQSEQGLLPRRAEDRGHRATDREGRRDPPKPVQERRRRPGHAGAARYRGNQEGPQA